ncbi:hypothetical protein [Mycobacterium sp. 155]|nr:hypothetical protein [Mycobacterium sp. 155]
MSRCEILRRARARVKADPVVGDVGLASVDILIVHTATWNAWLV